MELGFHPPPISPIDKKNSSEKSPLTAEEISLLADLREKIAQVTDADFQSYLEKVDAETQEMMKEMYADKKEHQRTVQVAIAIIQSSLEQHSSLLSIANKYKHLGGVHDLGAALRLVESIKWGMEEGPTLH